ncbi:MAG: hypothetical protein M0P61_12905 [Ignavibacteriaceae bacterium]|nr:hypothetical protein [Ignavibacteriaceae bacterium]
MNAEDLTTKTKVEVMLIKGGCCSSTSGANSVVEKSKTLLHEIGSELNLDFTIKEISFSEALSGPYPPELKTKGWEIFSRSGMTSIPMIIFANEIISTGLPDKNVIKKALKN